MEGGLKNTLYTCSDRYATMMLRNYNESVKWKEKSHLRWLKEGREIKTDESRHKRKMFSFFSLLPLSPSFSPLFDMVRLTSCLAICSISISTVCNVCVFVYLASVFCVCFALFYFSFIPYFCFSFAVCDWKYSSCGCRFFFFEPCRFHLIYIFDEISWKSCHCIYLMSLIKAKLSNVNTHTHTCTTTVQICAVADTVANRKTWKSNNKKKINWILQIANHNEYKKVNSVY